MSSVENYTVGCSILTGKITLYRFGKRNPNLALEKRDATAEVMYAACQHLLHGAEKGAVLNVTVGDQDYELSIKPVASDTVPEGMVG